MSAQRAERYFCGGIRRVLENTGEAEFLARQVEALEEAVYTAPELALDLARAIIETACRTICNNMGWKVESFDFTDQLTYALRALHSHPGQAGDDAARQQIGRITNGLYNIVEGVGLLRNDYGLASHGKDGFSRIERVPRAEVVAGAADTVVRYLLEAWLVSRTPPEKPAPEYEDEGAFNEYLDSLQDEVDIFGGHYRASYALFTLDQDAYRAELLRWQEAGPNEEVDT